MKPVPKDVEASGALGDLLCRVRGVVSRAYPLSVGCLMFGSHIDHSADEDSDVDLIILVDEIDRPFHEMACIEGMVLDVHVITEKQLVAQFYLQARQRGCFYAKAVVEGVVVGGSEGLWNSIKREASSVYFSRRSIDDWSSIRYSLTSRIKDLDHGWGRVERVLIASEILKNLLCIFGLRERGLVARMDVMMRWLMSDCPELAGRINVLFEAAVDGDVSGLKGIASDELESIGGPIRFGEKFHIRSP